MGEGNWFLAKVEKGAKVSCSGWSSASSATSCANGLVEQLILQEDAESAENGRSIPRAHEIHEAARKSREEFATDGSDPDGKGASRARVESFP